MRKIASFDSGWLMELFLIVAKIISDQTTIKCCRDSALSAAIVFAKVLTYEVQAFYKSTNLNLLTFHNFTPQEILVFLALKNFYIS